MNWLDLRDRFDEKPFRDRAIVGGVVLLTCYALWDFFVFSPQGKDLNTIREKIENSERELTKINAQEQVFAQAMTRDANAPKRDEIEALKNRMRDLNQELASMSTGLIIAERLPAILQDVLNNTGRLELSALRTRKPDPIALGETNTMGEESIETETSKPEYQVYRHPVTIELRGRYFDVVQYLQALEGLPWKFYWQELDYRVDQYPNARVSVEVYTLSTETGVMAEVQDG